MTKLLVLPTDRRELVLLNCPSVRILTAFKSPSVGIEGRQSTETCRERKVRIRKNRMTSRSRHIGTKLNNSLSFISLAILILVCCVCNGPYNGPGPVRTDRGLKQRVTLETLRTLYSSCVVLRDLQPSTEILVVYSTDLRIENHRNTLTVEGRIWRDGIHRKNPVSREVIPLSVQFYRSYLG